MVAAKILVPSIAGMKVGAIDVYEIDHRLKPLLH